MVMFNPEVAQQREKDWEQADEGFLFWFSKFFPVLQEYAGYLEVSQQALAELALARELFVGSFCPCHLLYDPAATPDIPALLVHFDRLTRRMAEYVDRHPAMTDQLRRRMGIFEFNSKNYHTGNGQQHDGYQTEW
ncbi:MAG: hypothetical protein JXQ73_22490 [Phycisphaerae bacterium]|nr:hypothetical protein [Phycisphaerae bacterium]